MTARREKLRIHWREWYAAARDLTFGWEEAQESFTALFVRAARHAWELRQGPEAVVYVHERVKIGPEAVRRFAAGVVENWGDFYDAEYGLGEGEASGVEDTEGSIAELIPVVTRWASRAVPWTCEDTGERVVVDQALFDNLATPWTRKPTAGHWWYANQPGADPVHVEITEGADGLESRRYGAISVPRLVSQRPGVWRAYPFKVGEPAPFPAAPPGLDAFQAAVLSDLGR